MTKRLSATEGLGTVYACITMCYKAREYIETALAIRKEIKDNEREAWCYVDLGVVY